MDIKAEEFAKSIGFNAGHDAIEAYKESNDDYVESWSAPMLFSSGFTTHALLEAFVNEWITPLRKQLRISVIALGITVILFACALVYSWSIMDYETFSRFLIAFVPAIVALIFSITKAYKTWAEAKKALAEARQIEHAISKSNQNAE